MLCFGNIFGFNFGFVLFVCLLLFVYCFLLFFLHK